MEKNRLVFNLFLTLLLFAFAMNSGHFSLCPPWSFQLFRVIKFNKLYAKRPGKFVIWVYKSGVQPFKKKKIHKVNMGQLLESHIEIVVLYGMTCIEHV